MNSPRDILFSDPAYAATDCHISSPNPDPIERPRNPDISGAFLADPTPESAEADCAELSMRKEPARIPRDSLYSLGGCQPGYLCPFWHDTDGTNPQVSCSCSTEVRIRLEDAYGQPLIKCHMADTVDSLHKDTYTLDDWTFFSHGTPDSHQSFDQLAVFTSPPDRHDYLLQTQSQHPLQHPQPERPPPRLGELWEQRDWNWSTGQTPLLAPQKPVDHIPFASEHQSSSVDMELEPPHQTQTHYSLAPSSVDAHPSVDSACQSDAPIHSIREQGERNVRDWLEHQEAVRAFGFDYLPFYSRDKLSRKRAWDGQDDDVTGKKTDRDCKRRRDGHGLHVGVEEVRKPMQAALIQEK